MWYIGIIIMTAFIQLGFCQNPLSLLGPQEYIGQSLQKICNQKNYLSSESFLGFADHVFCYFSLTYMGNISLDTNNVMEGDSIFVSEYHALDFILNYHPKINNSYVLLIGISGLDYNGEILGHIVNDSKVLSIFSSDVNKIRHPKIIPVPLGIWSDRFFPKVDPASSYSIFPKGNRNWDTYIDTLSLIRSRSLEKRHLGYLNVTVERCPLRASWFNYLKDKPFCYTVEQRIPCEEFLEDIARSHFVFSPPGDAFDCFRTWEALYLGSIPIVISSAQDSLYEGLPVVIIQNIEEVNEKFLLEKLDEFSKQEFCFSKLDPEYWRTLILSYKNRKV